MSWHQSSRNPSPCMPSWHQGFLAQHKMYVGVLLQMAQGVQIKAPISFLSLHHALGVSAHQGWAYPGIWSEGTSEAPTLGLITLHGAKSAKPLQDLCLLCPWEHFLEPGKKPESSLEWWQGSSWWCRGCNSKSHQVRQVCHPPNGKDSLLMQF